MYGSFKEIGSISKKLADQPYSVVEVVGYENPFIF